MFHAIWLQLGFADMQDNKGPESSTQGAVFTPYQLKLHLLVEMLMCMYEGGKKSDFCKKIKLELAGIYDDGDDNTPGPFSVASYIK